MKIYKKDTRGKVRVLEVVSKVDTVIQTSGLLKGKHVTHIKKIHAKNIGKKNETTATQQAIKEAKAIIVKKLKEGYFKTEKEAKNSNFILPMLAKEFGKEEKKVKYPCFVQPKFDGMRCLAIMKNNTITLLSRKNREIITMKHIKDDLNFFYVEDRILDGELYAHGKTFQENMTLLKKYEKGESEKVNYHIYDMISSDGFKARNEALNALNLDNSTYLKSVKTIKIKIREELDENHKKFLKDGYEGTMIRWGEDGYKINGRSSNLLKFKDFKDLALTIVDVVESDRVPGNGIVVVEYNGHRSKTGSKISHKERKELWKNRTDYIGKTAEIRYFEETDKGALRFPVYMGVRLDK